MEIHFCKYHGTGNDFIMIDNRNSVLDVSREELVRDLCRRHTGIGADGLISLEQSEEYDFYMRYFNADGREGSMCGNGGRCVVAFAKALGIIGEHCIFDAVDGLHTARISGDIISLKMSDVHGIRQVDDAVFLDTGSPHHISFVERVHSFPVYEKGKEIRYSSAYKEGTNVNFVEQSGEQSFFVRTYERGVEDETLSCGTGVTAVALAAHHTGKTKDNKVILHTLGGDLSVEFEYDQGVYKNIYLSGPAVKVYEGVFEG